MNTDSHEECSKTYNTDIFTVLKAISNKQYNIIKFLLEKHININRLLVSHSNEIYKYLDVTLCNILIECEADINIIDKNNRTPLFYAVKNNDYDMVKLLLKNGANVNLQDNIGYSCLHIAGIHNSNIEIVDALISYKPDLNSRDWVGRTPLHIFVIESNFEAVKSLLKAGAYVGLKDKCKHFPIYHSVMKLDHLISGLLLKYGANPNTVNGNGKTLLSMAVISNNTLMVEQLLLYGADVNNGGYDVPAPIISAINVNNYDIVKILLHNGANINVSTEDGRTSLHTAMFWNNSKIIDELLNYGSDINSVDAYGRTPLSCYRSLSYDIATKLISRIVITDVYHDTPANIIGFMINLKTIENNSIFKLIKNDCLKEINMLKSITLNKVHSSDIFIRYNTDICLLTRFIKHPKIIGLDRKLYAYRSIVNKRKAKAIHRYYQVKKILTVLPFAGYFSILPFDVLIYILEFISDNNILVLMRALSLKK
ncbi:ankyrin repeat containing protein [Finch poxvirus]|uniref:Ankyrin repeat containing protein n=2 Tax=unclassified Avipoxvirus TaxID=336487 RepID=A0AAT9UQB8_9POXV|nr:ankyrin repeat containing protein [Finch poxvirus]UOX39066.1 ankyrin repeat containing protein [Finch poxvirus]